MAVGQPIVVVRQCLAAQARGIDTYPISCKIVVAILQICYNARMDALFGSKTRTDVLVALGRVGSAYVAQLARLLGKRYIEVQRALISLERAGVVQTRRVGNVRIAELNRRFPEYEQLSGMLLTMSERPVYASRWKGERRRPRAMGKAR
jgi:DNA-binding transcriptional ArsR family regulator